MNFAGYLIEPKEEVFHEEENDPSQLLDDYIVGDYDEREDDPN